ncbi:hypothetical protein FA95DRAFT_1045385 [Auriscalpium vulgare]|uniref:Uncharacterized protein n=1 Tax=Auriscalpium vulgare TaxID=40419 RepID=A0ACB8S8I9_9AGAM|nr:hypothetical protein FA95DRAFT_1045385 [Auriscalpium vulgare]
MTLVPSSRPSLRARRGKECTARRVLAAMQCDQLFGRGWKSVSRPTFHVEHATGHRPLPRRHEPTFLVGPRLVKRESLATDTDKGVAEGLRACRMPQSLEILAMVLMSLTIRAEAGRGEGRTRSGSQRGRAAWHPRGAAPSPDAICRDVRLHLHPAHPSTMATDSVLVLLAVRHRHWPARSSCGSHHTRAPTRLPNVHYLPVFSCWYSHTSHRSRELSTSPETAVCRLSPAPPNGTVARKKSPMLRPNLHGACKTDGLGHRAR